MNDDLLILTRALKSTALWIIFVFTALTMLTIIVAPFIIVVGLEGPTWAAILAAAWGIVSFIFVLALLHELE